MGSHTAGFKESASVGCADTVTARWICAGATDFAGCLRAGGRTGKEDADSYGTPAIIFSFFKFSNV